MTIASQAKLAIDIAGQLKSLNVDSGGDFSEGSVSVNFVGTVMPLVGQMTMTNPALGLIHETVMVENDPGHTDIPQELDGLWWNISGGRDAKVMVTNTSAFPASADVFLDFDGERHPSDYVLFKPYETRTLSVTQLLGELKMSPANVPEGGITIIQRELKRTLIAQGKVLDPVTGFSTTLNFPDPEVQLASALHASGVPIGKPTPDSLFAGIGTFVPHVVVRNLTGSPQVATITIEYPSGMGWDSTTGPYSAGAQAGTSLTGQNENLKGGVTTGHFTLPPFSVGPYSTVDLPLGAALNQLPTPLPFCSIRIQYSGRPGSAIAEVSSVELKSDMVIDAPLANEGNGWAGSGANPWHLDKDTESILFLTDEGDQPVRIAFSVTTAGLHYYLTDLKLAPHETRAINMRKLRDAQQADFRGTLIPADATDGGVTWQRAEDVPVAGRLLVIKRHSGMASNYDCNICTCPVGFNGGINLQNGASSVSVLDGSSMGLTLQGSYTNPCNGTESWMTPQSGVTWSSGTPSVATVNSSGTVSGVSGGSSTISVHVSEQGCYWNGQGGSGSCHYFTAQGGAGLSANVQIPYQLNAVNTPTTTVCSGNSCQLAIKYQVLDVNGVAVQVAGMTIAESTNFTSGSQCTGNFNDAKTWLTDSTGTMTTPDYWWWCCTNGSCTFTFTQTFSVNGHTIYVIRYNGFSGTHNITTIQCNGSNVSPCPVVTPTP
ncbi:MAG TPA: Ig-like domain-containing protein [Terriglobia bacterium]|nr:Ig-like domain-containing protein [Terriglobia bacterium]